MKILFALQFILALSGFNHLYYNNILSSNADQKTLTILIYNETGYPLSISRSPSFSKLKNYQAIAYKKVDTVKLSVNDYEYIYFSNKFTTQDTILVSGNDTLTLLAKGENIQAKLLSKNKLTDSFLYAGKLYNKRDSVVRLQQQIDSLTRFFYSIDSSSAPFVAHNDVQKFIDYPLKVNRDAFNGKRDALQMLLTLLKNNTGTALGSMIA